jgi:hypothetical protein
MQPPFDMLARLKDVGRKESLDLADVDLVETGQVFDVRPDDARSWRSTWNRGFSTEPFVWIGELSVERGVPTVTMTFSPMSIDR